MQQERDEPGPVEDGTGHEAQAVGVLVVRSAELRERVGAALAGAGREQVVELSPSYLSAMGWLADSSPAVIIGPVSAMTGMVSSTARALRKLCPGVRLVVVAQPDERDEAQASLEAGFDHCVFEPAEATVLLSALALPDPPVAAASDAGNATRASGPDAADSTTAERSGPAESIPSHVLPGDALGDTDLVEALLEEGGGLASRAQVLLEQQSQIPGIAIAQSAAEVSPSNAVVAVHCNGQQLGLLHAPAPATSEQLTPWADWLAHWLALDRHLAELRVEAMTDELTGVWNRRYFQRFLEARLEAAARERQQVTLLLFDIDDFKRYNDKYGHPAGDEILRETARLIQSLVRDHDIVARIGGDEFAVVFWDKGEPRHLGSQHPDNVLGIARRFQKAICEHKYPKLAHEAVGRLTVSGGLAGFPWDGRSPEELIAQADAMAIQSKRTGKNVICFGPGAAPNGNGGGETDSV